MLWPTTADLHEPGCCLVALAVARLSHKHQEGDRFPPMIRYDQICQECPSFSRDQVLQALIKLIGMRIVSHDTDNESVECRPASEDPSGYYYWMEPEMIARIEQTF